MCIRDSDRGTLYDVADAVSLVKKTAVAKFDETIEAHIRTGSVSYTHLDVYKRQD